MFEDGTTKGDSQVSGGHDWLKTRDLDKNEAMNELDDVMQSKTVANRGETDAGRIPKNNRNSYMPNPEEVGKAISKYFLHLSFLVAVIGYVCINSFGSPMGIGEYFGYVLFLALLFMYYHTQIWVRGNPKKGIGEREVQSALRNNTLRLIIYSLTFLLSAFLVVVIIFSIGCSSNECRELLLLI